MRAAAYCAPANDSKAICLPKAQTTLFNLERNRKYSVLMLLRIVPKLANGITAPRARLGLITLDHLRMILGNETYGALLPGGDFCSPPVRAVDDDPQRNDSCAIVPLRSWSTWPPPRMFNSESTIVDSLLNHRAKTSTPLGWTPGDCLRWGAIGRRS